MARTFEGLDRVLVHPFSDRAVMAGNGTIALAILEDLPDVEAVLVRGVAVACAAASPATFASWHPTSRCTRLSPRRRRRCAPRSKQTTPARCLTARRSSTASGRPVVLNEMFELGRQLVDGSLVSRLDDVERALRLIVTRNHVVPEGAGSVDVAAALGGESGEGCVTCVVSDGNIDVGLLARLLEADVS